MSSKYNVTSAKTLAVKEPGVHLRAFAVNANDASDERYYILALCDRSKREFQLHWGIAKTSETEWLRPNSASVPPFQPTDLEPGFATTSFLPFSYFVKEHSELKEWLTEFIDCEGLEEHEWTFIIFRLSFLLPRDDQFIAIVFVLKYLPQNLWLKEDGSKNFVLNLTTMEDADREAKLIIDFEKKLGSAGPETSTRWTVEAGHRTFTLKARLSTLKDKLVLVMFVTHPNHLVLHWGGAEQVDSEWSIVSTKLLDEWSRGRSVVINEKALQTKFEFEDPKVSIQVCRISIAVEGVPRFIKFVLKETGSQTWFKNGSADFSLEVPVRSEWHALREEAARAAKVELEAIAAKREQQLQKWSSTLAQFEEQRSLREELGTIAFQGWTLSDNVGVIDCAVSSDVDEDPAVIRLDLLACLMTPCLLHWGCVGSGGEIQRRKDGEWVCPPAELLPPNTEVFGPKAAQTPMVETDKDFIYQLSINFPAKRVPISFVGDSGVRAEFGGVAFVMKEIDGNRWFKANDGRDLLIRLYPSMGTKWTGPHKDLVNQIIEAEVEWDHMTLMHRYQLCLNLTENRLPLSKAAVKKEQIDEEHEFWSWIFVWNRFSFLSWLDWQRRYNTKPKDLAHAAEVLSCAIARDWKLLDHHRCWLRPTLATMGRGGSAGQTIRDRILDIMHKHKLPEIAGNFYEQWHQKLHNNTTPDDIPICTAVIEFLQKGGNKCEFWRVLHQSGIDAEKLKSYERPITVEPYMPHCDIGGLIWDLHQYLDILKEVHDCLDLGKSANRVRHLLSGAIQGRLDHVLHEASQGQPHSFGAVCDRIGRIYDVRKDIITRLIGRNDEPWTIRDMLLLDFSLESVQTTLLQGARKEEGTQDQWVHILGWFIELLALHNPRHDEFKVICDDWLKIGHAATRRKFTGDERLDALAMKSLIDRLTRSVGETIDFFQAQLGPKSNYLGNEVGVDPHALNVFVDEVLRGGGLFSVSVGIKYLEPLIRAAAELPPWQLISVVPRVRGYLSSVATLTNIQNKVFDVPTILISDAVNGEEEIPTGVQAVLVRSASAAPDILSHVSVRARNAHVLLAVSFDPDIVAHWEQKFQNSWVEISVILGGSDLEICAIEQPFDLPISEPDVEEKMTMRRQVSRKLSSTFDRQVAQSTLDEIDRTFTRRRSSSLQMAAAVDLNRCADEYIVTIDQFDKNCVGSKSNNLQTLKKRLPHMNTPRAFALPYGSLQKVLSTKENDQVLALLKRILSILSSNMDNENVQRTFNEVQRALDDLQLPAELSESLKKRWPLIESTNEGTDSGLVMSSLESLYNGAGGDRCWEAMKLVWKSVFAMRPWISLAKANRSYMSLNMAILVQELFPADYAFVLHSKNPFGEGDGGEREMYGEIVVGLGEVLVGNYPGRALSWKMKESDESPTVVAFPSKAEALISKATLIFRSDSNGEDLEGFAGAGLFESIPAILPEKQFVNYHQVRLVTDHEYRKKLLREVGRVAFDIEDAFGLAMDIEGLLCKGKIVIVQARPQV